MHCVSTDNDASQHVDHLNRSRAVDDDVAVADEGEIFVITFVVVFVRLEHQLETAGIVVVLGTEGVARVLEQVNFGAGEIVE